MKLKVTSKDGRTSVVNVETGESLVVEALRFEHPSPDDIPRLTITLLDINNEIEVDAEVQADRPTECPGVLFGDLATFEIENKSVADVAKEWGVPEEKLRDRIATWRHKEPLL